MQIEAACMPTAQVWGLKPDLSWADCVEEATAIAEDADVPLEERAAWARRLLEYIAQHQAQITAASPADNAKPYKAQLKEIAFHPAREPCSHAAVSAKGVVVSADLPQGDLCLRAASALLPAQAP